MFKPRTPLGIRIVIPMCNYAYTYVTASYRQSYDKFAVSIRCSVSELDGWSVGKLVGSVFWLVNGSVGHHIK